MMAEAVGISPSSVGRIWADAGLKPHVVKGFKVSNDPMFEAKDTEIVGLYLDPPERAIQSCCAWMRSPRSRQAYGWPADISEDDALARLRDLNRVRAVT